MHKSTETQAFIVLTFLTCDAILPVEASALERKCGLSCRMEGSVFFHAA